MTDLMQQIAENMRWQDEVMVRNYIQGGTLKQEVIPMEQMLIDGVANDLMKAAQSFVDVKNEIQEAKVKLEELSKKVLAEMVKEGKETLTITVGTENYFFEIKHGEDDLRCVKQTKSPVIPTEELDL